MNLVIVESPNKCDKIKSFLGPDFVVEASVGHIRKIPEKGLHVNETTFEPDFEIERKKLDIVKKIRKLASKADKIFLATDQDREGEAISWHVMQILPESDREKCVRSSFLEITKKAVTDAIENPRTIDYNLVLAQKARQVLDRLIGYKASPTVWYSCGKGTSAGRVQSPALRIICNRQREIDAFKSEDFWYIDADLQCGKGVFQARVNTVDKDNRYIDYLKVGTDLYSLRNASCVLSNVERKEKRNSPYPPFDSVSIVMACSSIYGWSASKTMSTAQEIFASGKISYHRTDSYSISKEAMDEVRLFLSAQYLDALPPKPNVYFKKSSAAASEAHECIRPTHVIDTGTDLVGDSRKLYDLIRARFIACQMTDMIVDTVKYTISASSGHTLTAHGQTIRDQGWFAAYPYSKTKDEILPNADEDEKLITIGVIESKHSTQPPAKYNDGSLVKRLEDDAIGRPSTRASILKALETKEYVTKENKAFVPTSLGKDVCEFLEPRFDDYFMNFKYTAMLEDDLDLIAEGKKTYIEVLKPAYDFLMKKVSEARASTPKKVIVLAGGKCPVCKTGDVVEKVSRYGKFFTCSNWPRCSAILVKKEDGKFSLKLDMIPSISEKSGKKCPECGKDLLVRVNRRKGTKFFGCAGYPDCKHAEKIVEDKKS